MTTLLVPDEPFLFSDLDRFGLSRTDLTQLVEQGTVHRLLRGLYVPSHLPDTVEARTRAVQLVLPPHCVVSDLSAVWLHGLETMSPHPVTGTRQRLDVVSTQGLAPRARAGLRVGERDLLPSEIVEINGVRVTSAERTACDVACLEDRATGLATLDAFMRHCGIGNRDLDRMLLARFRGRRGVRQARHLAALASPKAQSPGESWVRLALIDEGLPPPDLQIELWVPAYGDAFLDMGWLELRRAVEYDGREYHSSDEDVERDQTRRAALAGMGWTITVVTAELLSRSRREEWLGPLRREVTWEQRHRKRRYGRGPESW